MRVSKPTLRQKALGKFLGHHPVLLKEDGQDKNTVMLLDNRQEYLILTDKQATKRAKEEILDSLWAFKSEFIVDHIPTKDKWFNEEEHVKEIRRLQENMCEGANFVVKCFIGKNLKSFIQDAIDTDGRGHFISWYDSKEHEVEIEGKTFFIYRTN